MTGQSTPLKKSLTMDFLNNNVASTIIGAIVGGIIAIIAGDITCRRQRKDVKEKEDRENFKKNKAKPNKNGFIDTEISKAYSNKEKLKHEIIYLENIGRSDINELEIAIAEQDA